MAVGASGSQRRLRIRTDVRSSPPFRFFRRQFRSLLTPRIIPLHPPVPRSRVVLTILLVLLVMFLGLGGLLWAGSIFVQGYIYEAPNFSSLAWRAPATAAAITLFLFFWCWLDYKAASPEKAELPYNTLFS